MQIIPPFGTPCRGAHSLINTGKVVTYWTFPVTAKLKTNIRNIPYMVGQRFPPKKSPCFMVVWGSVIEITSESRLQLSPQPTAK